MNTSLVNRVGQMVRNLDPEFTYSPPDLPRWRATGWEALVFGVVLVAVGLFAASRSEGILVLVGPFVLGAMLLLYGLSSLRPRPFEIHAMGVVLPAFGLIGRVLVFRWLDIRDVTEISLRSSPGGTSLCFLTRHGRKFVVPQVLLGVEGIQRVRTKWPSLFQASARSVNS